MRALSWLTAAAALVCAGVLTFVYVGILATSDLHGRCEDIYQENYERGEVVSARRQLMPPAIACTVRSFGQLHSDTRPPGAAGFFVLTLMVDTAAVLLLVRAVRRSTR